MRPKPTFDKLLEHYVYSVAARFIDLMDSQGQTKLMDFINQIELPTPSVEDSVTSSPGESTRSDVAPLLVTSYTTHLEEQWQTALKPPLEPVLVSQPVYSGQYILNCLQTSIDSTRVTIGRMDQLIERAGLQPFDQARTARLLTHYESIRKRFVVYLAKLEVLQQQERTKRLRG